MSESPAHGTRYPALLRVSLGLHAGAGLGLALAPSSWPLALAAIGANHLVIALAGMLPRCALLGPNLTRLPPAAASGVVALTFDDGPDPVLTPRVLDLLEQRGARATFFCLGRLVDLHPELTREIARRGHQVENHSHRHSHTFGFLGPGRLRGEIARAQDSIEAATGRRPTLFRAPAGIRNLFLQPELERLGLRLVSWTRRGFDTVSRRPATVAARLCAGLRQGDILVLHDGAPLRGASGPTVVAEVLPRLLDALAGTGLRSVPIAEALGFERARP